jgi:hypothetical protein
VDSIYYGEINMGSQEKKLNEFLENVILFQNLFSAKPSVRKKVKQREALKKLKQRQRRWKEWK